MLDRVQSLFGDPSDDSSFFGRLDTAFSEFGALGNDPSMDGYGSTRFKAEVYGFNANVFADHSAYFEPGSESLYSIGDIASGNGDKLQEHGMTAQHRGAGVLPDFVDPELFRRATTGHHH
jgi:hypothetical protein